MAADPAGADRDDLGDVVAYRPPSDPAGDADTGRRSRALRAGDRRRPLSAPTALLIAVGALGIASPLFAVAMVVTGYVGPLEAMTVLVLVALWGSLVAIVVGWPASMGLGMALRRVGSLRWHLTGHALAGAVVGGGAAAPFGGGDVALPVLAAVSAGAGAGIARMVAERWWPTALR